jgi:hypothetical protein
VRKTVSAEDGKTNWEVAENCRRRMCRHYVVHKSRRVRSVGYVARKGTDTNADLYGSLAQVKNNVNNNIIIKTDFK